MTVRVGINGFGRVGRQVLKAIIAHHADTLEVVAINDLFDPQTNAHLFKYDLNYGIYHGSVDVKDKTLVVDNKPIQVFAEKDPANIPWASLGVEIVIEFDRCIHGCYWQSCKRESRRQRAYREGWGEEGDHFSSRQERGYHNSIGR